MLIRQISGIYRLRRVFEYVVGSGAFYFDHSSVSKEIQTVYGFLAT